MKRYKLYGEARVWNTYLSKIYATETNSEMTWVLDVADFIIAIVNMLKVLQGNIKKWVNKCGNENHKTEAKESLDLENIK